MPESTKQTPVWGRTLTAMAAHCEHARAARKRDLGPGDRVIVSTRNSVYCLQALGGDLFEVSGGWFERNPESRLTTINGCTYGGVAICTDIVAARGLFLEFGNNVSTTRIQRVLVVRSDRQSPGDQTEPLPN